MEAQDVKVEITFDDAEKLDALASKYFKAETNVQYQLTFSHWCLYRKKVPNFNNKDVLEDKSILELTVDSINGEPVNQEWGILSAKCRSAFEPYCRNGSILKKVFSYKSKGEGKDKVYQVAEVGDKESISIKAQV